MILFDLNIIAFGVFSFFQICCCQNGNLEIHLEEYGNMLKLHRSMELFIKDWINVTWYKDWRFTSAQEDYFNSLSIRQDSSFLLNNILNDEMKGDDAPLHYDGSYEFIFNLLNAMRENIENGFSTSNTNFHNKHFQRAKRETGDDNECKDEIEEYILKAKVFISENVKNLKKTLKKGLTKIGKNKDTDEESATVGPPPPSGGPQTPPIGGPPPPPDGPPSPPIGGPPPNPIGGGPPPPPIIEEEDPLDFGGMPTADPDKEVDVILGRNRRSVRMSHRKPYWSFSSKEKTSLNDALKWLMNIRVGGTSKYNIFALKQRMASAPEFYENIQISSEYINRFEAALQEYDASITLPYLDPCRIITNPSELEAVFTEVVAPSPPITDCQWIGYEVKRGIGQALTGERTQKLKNRFCDKSTSMNSFDLEDHALLHSIFGSCVRNGHHLACPSCAASDPVYWMLMAGLQERQLE